MSKTINHNPGRRARCGAFWSAAMAMRLKSKSCPRKRSRRPIWRSRRSSSASSGHKLNTTWNGTVDILKKLRAGEVFDMVILVTPSMEDDDQGGQDRRRQPCRPRSLRHRHCRPGGRAETRHQHDRRGETRAARCQGYRLFLRPERRVSRGPVQALGDLGSGRAEDQADAAGNAGRFDPRARRRRHRLPAGQRAPALSRHPVCRSGAAGDGHGQRLCRRRAHRRDAAGRRARADQIH